MLTTHTIKTLQSLDKKKFRQKYNLFLVEGNKIIKELKKSPFVIREIYSTDDTGLDFAKSKIHPITERELKKISLLQHPKDSVAVCELRNQSPISADIQLVLDNIQDPGNLGTIIRLCDWFGVETLLCNTQTVDCYNPKVVQASMGSLTRVAVHYLDLAAFLTTTALPVYTMDLEGENLYTATFPKDCILILGNEANGISSEVRALSNEVITIPRFSQHQRTESLNVAMAGAIILSEVMGHH